MWPPCLFGRGGWKISGQCPLNKLGRCDSYLRNQKLSITTDPLTPSGIITMITLERLFSSVRHLVFSQTGWRCAWIITFFTFKSFFLHCVLTCGFWEYEDMQKNIHTDCILEPFSQCDSSCGFSDHLKGGKLDHCEIWRRRKTRWCFSFPRGLGSLGSRQGTMAQARN